MCNCKNRDFEVINNKLCGEYDGDFHEYDENNYSFCPICGENLQPERLSEKSALLEACFGNQHIVSTVLRSVSDSLTS